MKHRFLVDDPVHPGADVSIRGREFHHGAKVRRVRAGEEIEIVDSGGAAWEAAVVAVTGSEIIARAGALLPSRESPLEITLAQALIRPEKFELVIQKATELGVVRIIPLLSERIELPLERVLGKIERWQRIAEEAVKQSGRTRTPAIESPLKLSEILARRGLTILFDADTPPGELPPQCEGVTLLVGPEGGLSPAEVELCLAAGSVVARLGPRRLRAETAAISAVVLAQSRWGDMGDGLVFPASSYNN
jgi:16S rRNA (uracil1498-N3)-methyltransferase